MKLSRIITIVIFLLLILLPVLIVFRNRDTILPRIFNREGYYPDYTTQQKKDAIEIVARDLYVPWDIAFMPDDTMLITQRDGKLLITNSTSKTITEIKGVRETSEGGLMGIALHPDFKENHFIFLYMTTVNPSSRLVNQVVRYTLESEAVSDEKIIITNIPGSNNHDGGALRFGSDGYLYITTGDAGDPDSAQDKSSLSGKILRITDEGKIPDANPYGNAVFSYGHRNSQGLAWDKSGKLWCTEHGPSGVESGNDEVNLIEKGNNYGWPVIKGKETRAGMLTPILESGTDDTWAPAGAAIINDHLYFTGLRGEALYEATINDDGTLSNFKKHFESKYGRLRAVVSGPDGFLYVSTSNRDGRGEPNSTDDIILRIDPEKL